MDVFERRLCDQAQKLYVINTCFMSQINPKKILHNTTKSVQHALRVTPFNAEFIVTILYVGFLCGVFFL